VDEDAHPLRRAVGPLGDEAVGQAAAGEQDDAGAAAVDGVGVLPLEAAQFPLFVGAQAAYPDGVHGPSPRSAMVAHLDVETVLCAARPGPQYPGSSEKVTDWMRH
jgi:hypothetical protein